VGQAASKMTDLGAAWLLQSPATTVLPRSARLPPSPHSALILHLAELGIDGAFADYPGTLAQYLNMTKNA
jgi:hypothetical protein